VLLSLWERFKVDWTQVRSMLENMLVCRVANRAEGTIPAIDDDTPFSLLVNVQADPSAISRVTTEIQTVIDDLVESMERASYPADSALGTLVQSITEAKVLDVTLLPFLAGNTHLFNEQPTAETIELFIASQLDVDLANDAPLLARDASMRFVEGRIRREIVSRFVGWQRVSAKGPLSTAFSPLVEVADTHSDRHERSALAAGASTVPSLSQKSV